MSARMRRFGIWSLTLGAAGLIAFGVVLFRAIDDPKARVSLAAWGFILAGAVGGAGVFALSMSAGRRRDAGDAARDGGGG